MKFKPIVLIILDGWGLSPSWGGNALTMNNPKNMENLWKNYPHTVLQALSTIASGEVVGDSRLGHTLIGAGRAIQSNYAIISESINQRSFFRNDTLLGAINWAKKNNSNLHLMGLVSDGGVHAHIDHLIGLLRLAHEQNFDRVFIDMITDGTDSAPTDSLRYIEKINNKILELGIGKFSSIGGRYYAMDRDEHWDRINIYYKAITEPSNTNCYNSITEAVTSNYKQGLNDEFIKPGLIVNSGKIYPIKSNDSVVFFNFREDRARELTQTFTGQTKQMFNKPKLIEDLYFATFINYQKNLPVKIVFPDMDYRNTLSEVVSKAYFRQLKIAESQKYAHVTYFFNGGYEESFVGEERKIITSANVQSFDQKPEMSAKEITDTAIRAIKSEKYELIVLNFANVDMVAHTGNIMATGQAVQIIDKLVQEIVDTNLKTKGATIITADHGNAEQMVQLKNSLNNDKETLHTLNPVPFILVTPENHKNLMQSAVSHQTNSLSKILNAQDTLADVAPTILELMQIPKPKEMTGHSLLKKLE
ncbi:MAG: 2,3-bisphosphoglycerate-independent phosphoglycerate mutase [Candidatus Berkelbacteria bacterium]